MLRTKLEEEVKQTEYQEEDKTKYNMAAPIETINLAGAQMKVKDVEPLLIVLMRD